MGKKYTEYAGKATRSGINFYDDLDINVVMEIIEYESWDDIPLDKRSLLILKEMAAQVQEAQLLAQYWPNVLMQTKNIQDQEYLNWYQKVRYNIVADYCKDFKVKTITKKESKGKKNLILESKEFQVYYKNQFAFKLSKSIKWVTFLRDYAKGKYIEVRGLDLKTDGNLETRISIFKRDRGEYKEFARDCKKVCYEEISQNGGIIQKLVIETPNSKHEFTDKRPDEKQVKEVIDQAKMNRHSTSYYRTGSTHWGYWGTWRRVHGNRE